MSWCDHCMKPHRQLADHHVDDRMEALCGPCWRYADYFDNLPQLPSYKLREKAA